MNRTIAVDVDGTLVVNGQTNERLVSWLVDRKAKGNPIMLWSARGKEYAEAAARQSGTHDLFDQIASKPMVIIDDRGWSWIKHTKVISKMDQL